MTSTVMSVPFYLAVEQWDKPGGGAQPDPMAALVFMARS
jgi:hypothetical protein